MKMTGNLYSLKQKLFFNIIAKCNKKQEFNHRYYCNLPPSIIILLVLITKFHGYSVKQPSYRFRQFAELVLVSADNKALDICR